LEDIRYPLSSGNTRTLSMVGKSQFIPVSLIIHAFFLLLAAPWERFPAAQRRRACVSQSSRCAYAQTCELICGPERLVDTTFDCHSQLHQSQKL
jgi:hypothetical protein